jgi:hypothetical protein
MQAQERAHSFDEQARRNCLVNGLDAVGERHDVRPAIVRSERLGRFLRAHPRARRAEMRLHELIEVLECLGILAPVPLRRRNDLRIARGDVGAAWDVERLAADRHAHECAARRDSCVRRKFHRCDSELDVGGTRFLRRIEVDEVRDHRIAQQRREESGADDVRTGHRLHPPGLPEHVAGGGRRATSDVQHALHVIRTGIARCLKHDSRAGVRTRRPADALLEPERVLCVHALLEPRIVFRRIVGVAEVGGGARVEKIHERCRRQQRRRDIRSAGVGERLRLPQFRRLHDFSIHVPDRRQFLAAHHRATESKQRPQLRKRHVLRCSGDILDLAQRRRREEARIDDDGNLCAECECGQQQRERRDDAQLVTSRTAEHRQDQRSDGNRGDLDTRRILHRVG